MHTLSSWKGLQTAHRCVSKAPQPSRAVGVVRRRIAQPLPGQCRAAAGAAAASLPQEPVKSFLPFNFPTFLGAASSVGALLMHLGYLVMVPASYFVYFLGASVFFFLWGSFATQATINSSRSQYYAAAAAAEGKYAELINTLNAEVQQTKQEAKALATSSEAKIKGLESSYNLQLKDVKAQLEAALQKAEEGSKAASAELAEVEARANAALSEVATLQADLQASQVKLQALQADLSSAQSQLSQAQQEGSTAAQKSQQLEQLQAELQQAKASLAAVQEEKDTAAATVAGLEKSLRDSTELVGVLKAQVEAEQTKAKEAAAAKAAAESSLTELKQSTESGASQLSSVKAELETSKAAAAKLTAQLDDLKAAKAAELAAVKKELSDLQAANKDVSAVSSQVAALQAQIDTLQQQRNNDQLEINALRRFADQTAAESRTLVKQNTTKNSEIMELRKQLVKVNPGRLFDNFKSFGAATFWTSLVEEYLMKPLERGGKLAGAAIIGAETGVWGADGNFPAVTQQEVEDLNTAFVNNSTAALTTKGIWIGKRKYDFSSMKNGVLHGRTWGGGCCIAAGTNTFVVGVWNDPLNVKPDDVEEQLVAVRDYLKSVGC